MLPGFDMEAGVEAEFAACPDGVPENEPPSACDCVIASPVNVAEDCIDGDATSEIRALPV